MSPPRLLSLHAAAPSAPALAPGRTIPIHRPSSTSPAGCLAPAAPGNRLPSAVRCAPGDFAERFSLAWMIVPSSLNSITACDFRSHGHSRYGIASAEDGRAVIDFVRRAAKKLDPRQRGVRTRLLHGPSRPKPSHLNGAPRLELDNDMRVKNY
jgi:hypothetical protein